MPRRKKSRGKKAGEGELLISQDDASDGTFAGTPAKKQKGEKTEENETLTTPLGRAGLRSGVTGANDSLRGLGFTRVTNGHGASTGRLGAAFTTLRCPGSRRFRELLRQLSLPKKVVILKCEGSTLFQGRLAQLRSAPSKRTLQPFEQDLKSPADSAIDVLTPETSDERMAPVRDLNQAERDRNQQVASVSGETLQVSRPFRLPALAPGLSLIISESLRDVIQNYYEFQAQVQGYVSETETKDVLVNKVQETAQSLSHLAREASNPAIKNTFVPPEVVDYVDDGRNPDIYTRELVEVVQRGNAVLNGKMNAFGTFSRIFANDIRKYFPDMTEEVNEIMGDDGKDSKDIPNGNEDENTETPGKTENGASSKR